MRCRLAKITTEIYRQYENIPYVGMFYFWRPAILVRDINLIKDVLIKQFNNFHDNSINVKDEVDYLVAKNPFILRGKEWKTLRTTLTPQYTSVKLKSVIPMMQKVAYNLTDYINQKITTNNSNCFEAKELSARFTGENTLMCAYGLEGRSFIDEIPIAFKMAAETTSGNRFVQFKQTLSIFSPTLGKIVNSTFIGRPVSRYFWDMISDTIAYRKKNNIVRNDYLDFIVNLQKLETSANKVTDADVIANALTFFLDAFETNAVAITYVLYELALHLDIQNNVREEIKKVLEHNRDLTYEDLKRLEYTENVIHESLRKNPILLQMTRICTETCKFTYQEGEENAGKDIVIEKGTKMIIPIEAIHYNPLYYPNPEKFDPNRFTDEIKNTRPKCCYFGFGEGPRICLGKTYAIQQTKIMLVALLEKFEIRMNSKTTVPYEPEFLQIFNVPKGGVYIDLHKI